MSESTTLKIDGLEKLIRVLKNQKVSVKVGILGSSNRDDSSVSNAQVGAAHEFGAPSRNLPQRSFLRIPLSKNLGKKIEASGEFSPATLKEVMRAKTAVPWAEKLGIIGVGVVLEAFDQQGPGWAPLTEKTMDKKKVKQILTETQQLRNSITYVVEGG